MLVDSHCHLSDARFDEDRSDVLLRAGLAGVEKILAIASDRADAVRVAALLDGSEEGAGSPQLWGTAGVHPHEAEAAGEGDLDFIRELAQRHSRIVAVGETGLDFFYDHSPRGLQEALFRDHLALAEELDLPIVVHSRNADELTARILKEWVGRVRGVLHCFTGGELLLETALGAGWMVSFTGIITFKKYEAQALVRSVPRERLMVETDAPYLAPVPHRGRRNEPSYVARVAEGLAAIRGEDPDEVEGYTSENAIRFFDLTPS
jgi:TatD DNase family protein